MESRHLNLVELTVSCQTGFVEKDIGAAAGNMPAKLLVGKGKTQAAFVVVVNNTNFV